MKCCSIFAYQVLSRKRLDGLAAHRSLALVRTKIPPPYRGPPSRGNGSTDKCAHREKKPSEEKYTPAACCHHGYSRPAAAGTKIAAPGADAPTGPQFESSHRKQHLPLGNRGPILKPPPSIWRRSARSEGRVVLICARVCSTFPPK